LEFFSSDPVRVAQAIQGLINAVLVMFISFNIIHWSDVQIAGFMAVANIVAGISRRVVGANATQRPLSAPQTKEGVPLVPSVPLTRGLDNK
jgi:hypothetical protein